MCVQVLAAELTHSLFCQTYKSLQTLTPRLLSQLNLSRSTITQSLALDGRMIAYAPMTATAMFRGPMMTPENGGLVRMLADAFLNKWRLKLTCTEDHAGIKTPVTAEVAKNAASASHLSTRVGGSQLSECVGANQLSRHRTLYMATHVPISTMASAALIATLVSKPLMHKALRRADVRLMRSAK